MEGIFIKLDHEVLHVAVDFFEIGACFLDVPPHSIENLFASHIDKAPRHPIEEYHTWFFQLFAVKYDVLFLESKSFSQADLLQINLFFPFDHTVLVLDQQVDIDALFDSYAFDGVGGWEVEQYVVDSDTSLPFITEFF